ncbi:MAG: hypothetical protein WCE75_01205, partial [Terracidiphilus sp.]
MPSPIFHLRLTVRGLALLLSVLLAVAPLLAQAGGAPAAAGASASKARKHKPKPGGRGGSGHASAGRRGHV